MPYSRTTRPQRYDPTARDWGFESRAEKLIRDTDFLDFEDPEDMPPDVVKKMLYDFEQNRIPNTQRNRELFLETQQLSQELRELGVVPEKIAPTSDGRGYVRLNYDELNKLLDMIPDEKEAADVQ